MSANPIDIAVGGAAQLGRAFRIVGVMPSLVLVAYGSLVVATRSPEGSLDISRVPTYVSGLDLKTTIIWGLAAIAIAFLLQPLQFSMVQILEGYWGSGRLGHTLRLARIRRNIEKWVHQARNIEDVDSVETDEGGTPLVIFGDTIDYTALDKVVMMDELSRLSRHYPYPHRMMPTRLGNMLRMHEDRGGSHWGLDAMTVFPHIALIAPVNQFDYLQDRRNEMDTAVRFVIVWGIGTIVTLAAFWAGGWSVLAAALPWTLVILSYQGAVGAADHYGEAISVLIDLNRHTFYEMLGLAEETTLQSEWTRNQTLMTVLEGLGDGQDLRYHKSKAP